MHTIREITRLPTMLAGLIAPRIRLGLVSASSRLRLGYASTTLNYYKVIAILLGLQTGYTNNNSK